MRRANMIGEQEAMRLRQQMARQLRPEWRLFLKCVAVVVVFATVVITMPMLGPQQDTAQQALAAMKPVPR
jgi:hypothetical protein